MSDQSQPSDAPQQHMAETPDQPTIPLALWHLTLIWNGQRMEIWVSPHDDTLGRIAVTAWTQLLRLPLPRRQPLGLWLMNYLPYLPLNLDQRIADSCVHDNATLLLDLAQPHPLTPPHRGPCTA